SKIDCYVFEFIFFFFQAEDGIRDDLVTGVQTCALPIWQPAAPVGPLLAAGCRIFRKHELFPHARIGRPRVADVRRLPRDSYRFRSEERRVGKECRFRWSTYY